MEPLAYNIDELPPYTIQIEVDGEINPYLVYSVASFGFSKANHRLMYDLHDEIIGIQCRCIIELPLP